MARRILLIALSALGAGATPSEAAKRRCVPDGWHVVARGAKVVVTVNGGQLAQGTRWAACLKATGRRLRLGAGAIYASRFAIRGELVAYYTSENDGRDDEGSYGLVNLVDVAHPARATIAGGAIVDGVYGTVSRITLEDRRLTWIACRFDGSRPTADGEPYFCAPGGARERHVFRFRRVGPICGPRAATTVAANERLRIYRPGVVCSPYSRLEWQLDEPIDDCFSGQGCYGRTRLAVAGPWVLQFSEQIGAPTATAMAT